MNDGGFRVANTDGSVTSINSRAGTPTYGNAASLVLTNSGTAPADGATVRIGATTYTWKTALTASTTANQVLIGVSVATSLANLVSAVNKTTGGGTTYGSLTVLNTSASAASTSTTLTVTNKVVGVIGNSTSVGVPSTTIASHCTWAGAATHLTGGADSTTGVAGDIRFDGIHLYLALADVTTASTTGWIKATMAAL